MPAKGKHRRPKSLRFTRSIAVAGTGGAALALPLMGATGAHAATPATAVTQHVEKAATAAAKAATTKTYAVKTGDYLSKIADEHNVSGGWKKIYSDNRSAIGGDPSLIHPGLKLSLGKKAASTGAAHAATHAATRATTSAAKTDQATPATDTAASNGASTSSGSGYTLPVQGSSVGTGYKVAGSMWSSGYHTGVDFVVPTGTTIKSIAAGTVVSAGWGGAYGNQVVIQHADGKYSQYAHMSSLSVSAGQTVTEGQQVGLSGATGNVTGPHLHFEIRTTPDYGSDVDPVAYLRSHGVAVG
ncbi:LysM peptidoglycan-binding domain-containing M23 family metallopeptidase [Streptomyces rhizosphaerihabitans]|uniref:LysM peptidoglycan-binding domain-containing M23 family metallopeptidase n=1 Tax=Streptomyces rhizosphaerihabitans TaxID=1266770 RepID=UPI0021C17424|nr:LysM peptidoglycan-binding domain-containing M23 family metallopeptidase [Streptomyces rhizosphaerihabitans]MCT9007872.1 LysM peptidoglycan-binding domain-containing M23 family metallopeptidase [Streptomyces rhizosphaerihabitans]